MKPFDPTDVDALRRILVEARVAADDIDGVVGDMLRKKRRRFMGRLQHKQGYRDGRRTLVQILEYMTPPAPPSPPPAPPPPPAERSAPLN